MVVRSTVLCRGEIHRCTVHLYLSPSRATKHDEKYVPTRPHTALRVSGTGGKEDTFVEEATVTFTKNVLKYRESTQSELC